MLSFLIDQVHLGQASTWLFIAGGFFTLVGMLMQRMLPLRVLLVAANALAAAGNMLSDQPILWIGNVGLIVINLIQITRIAIDAKPAKLPDDLKGIHASRFAAMTTREFLGFVQLGAVEEGTDLPLCAQGATPLHLRLLLSGTADVVWNGEVVAHLHAGDVFGEMSFFTGRVYSADVRARGPVRCVRWDQLRIAALERERPALYIKVIGALGADLVRKLQQERLTATLAQPVRAVGAGGDGGPANQTMRGMGSPSARPERLV